MTEHEPLPLSKPCIRPPPSLTCLLLFIVGEAADMGEDGGPAETRTPRLGTTTQSGSLCWCLHHSKQSPRSPPTGSSRLFFRRPFSQRAFYQGPLGLQTRWPPSTLSSCSKWTSCGRKCVFWLGIAFEQGIHGPALPHKILHCRCGHL